MATKKAKKTVKKRKAGDLNLLCHLVPSVEVRGRVPADGIGLLARDVIGRFKDADRGPGDDGAGTATVDGVDVLFWWTSSPAPGW